MSMRMLLPLSCLVGLAAGVLILVSPFYVSGGIVGWLDPVPPDAWLSHLMGIVASVFIGLIVIIGSGALAVTLGFAFAIESGANARTLSGPFTTNGKSKATPSAIGKLYLENEQKPPATRMDVSSRPTDGALTPSYAFCCHCGEKLNRLLANCPHCNGFLS